MPPSNTGFDQKDKTTCMHLLGEHNYKQPEGYVRGRLSSHWGSESWIGPLCFHFTHCNALAYSKARKSSRFEIPHLGITSHSISVVPPPEIVTLWPQLGCHDSWHILLNGGAGATINDHWHIQSTCPCLTHGISVRAPHFGNQCLACNNPLKRRCKF